MFGKKFIIVVFFIVGLAAYFIFIQYNDTKNKEESKPSVAETVKANDISVVQNDVLPSIEEYIKKNEKLSKTYVDVYVEQQGEMKIVVAFLPDTLKTLKTETEKLTNQFKLHKIKYIELTYSYEEMNDLSRKVQDKLDTLSKKGIHVLGSHTDMMKQTITVKIKNNNSSEKELIQTISDSIQVDEKFVKVELEK